MKTKARFEAGTFLEGAFWSRLDLKSAGPTPSPRWLLRVRLSPEYRNSPPDGLASSSLPQLLNRIYFHTSVLPRHTSSNNSPEHTRPASSQGLASDDWQPRSPDTAERLHVVALPSLAESHSPSPSPVLPMQDAREGETRPRAGPRLHGGASTGSRGHACIGMQTPIPYSSLPRSEIGEFDDSQHLHHTP